MSSKRLSASSLARALAGGAEAAEAELFARDFGRYAEAAWPQLETGAHVPGWHLDCIRDHLAAVALGKIRRLIVNVPPRTGKSTNASVFWPTWCWARDARTRFVFASYSGRLATKHNVDRRTLIRSRWFRRRWGWRCSISRDVDTKIEFTNEQAGSMFASSVGGSITGLGGDVIVVDDPHATDEAQSEAMLDAVWAWWRNTVVTRLNDPKRGAIVIIMHRLHERDLTGRLLANEPGVWTLLRLPMVAERGWGDEPIRSPLGRTWRRKEGELLCPERFGPDEVAGLKVSMGTYNFAGQAQQRPAPAAGGIIQRAWMRFFRGLPPRIDRMIQSWDMTFKDVASAAFVVGQAWAHVGARALLVDQVRDRMDFPSTLRAVETFSAKWPLARQKLVEEAANGPAVVDMLKRRVPGLVLRRAEGSKDSRLAAVSPYFEAGNVELPADAPWVNDYVEELCSSPMSAYRDQGDATSQALLELFSGGPGVGFKASATEQAWSAAESW